MHAVKISGWLLSTNGTDVELNCYVFMEREETGAGYIYKIKDDFYGSLSEKQEVITDSQDWTQIAYDYFLASHEMFYSEMADGRLFRADLVIMD